MATVGGLTTGVFAHPQQASATEHGEQQSAKKADVAEDLNGDGFADLVSGAPGGTVSGKAKAGYVAVTYGSAKGLDTANKQLVSRSTSGVPGSATAEQEFGKSFSKGDLDGDGYADLVIGSADASSGSVILWGSAKGLTGGTAIPGFGTTPQIGDFDGDKQADLALLGDPGSSGDDPVKQPAALWKGPVTRSGTPAKKLDFLDRSEWDDENNSATSISGPSTVRGVADVNGDGRQDLTFRRYEGDGVYSSDALLGSPSGFTVSQGPDDGGGDLDAGDVDGDGYDDLVVSGGSDLFDEVTVVFGAKDGLSADRRQKFDQSLEGFPGEAPSDGEMLGSCVSVADVTGDGRAEVALGIRWKNSGDKSDAGAVALLHGSDAGVTGQGSQLLDQDSPGVPGVAEEKDEFGAACALVDVDGDGHRDLNVSSTQENDSSGAVWSLRGTGTGLTTDDAASFGPSDLGAPVDGAQLGSSIR
ncbi:FG-GAP repeat domain-containing protein [Streptomyces reniochalinae]|uniref:VCBS repeat-containing protein n=1 Tax=Streptomyces reniochalinae TaxID=2250578 RepID=A0A367E705_9ACTN|nr:FG-GAP and VCBS repeat-containing protein [Streptomyces reniochalinae]RCG13771.1 VCBS repeat-containing protein [Streptomyces reniochalinae]